MQTNELTNKIGVIRGNKRVRTISAKLKSGDMYVNASANTLENDIQKVSEKFKNSFARKTKYSMVKLHKTQYVTKR